MARFRKKPVIVEATRWFRNGDHPQDDCRQMSEVSEGFVILTEGKVVRRYRHPGVSGDHPCEHCNHPHDIHGWIDTLEGGHIVCPGDWVITGVAGERYPCKDSIFRLTYEEVP